MTRSSFLDTVARLCARLVRLSMFFLVNFKQRREIKGKSPVPLCHDRPRVGEVDVAGSRKPSDAGKNSLRNLQVVVRGVPRSTLPKPWRH